MKTFMLLSILLCSNLIFCQKTGQNIRLKLPNAPNKISYDGKSIGEWIYYFNSKGNIELNPSKVTHYIRTNYNENGNINGKTAYYLRNGKKLFEGHAELINNVFTYNGVFNKFEANGDTTVLFFEDGNEVDISEYSNIIENLCEAKNFEKALSVAEKRLSIIELIYGKKSPKRFKFLNQLQDVYFSKGEVLNALKVRQGKDEELYEPYAFYLTYKGTSFFNQGSFENAELLYLKASQIRRVLFADKLYFGYDQSLDNLGILYRNTGEFEKAEKYFKEALEIRKTRYGENSVEYSVSIEHLANLYTYQDLFQGGIDMSLPKLYFDKLLEIRKNLFGKNSIQYILCLSKASVFEYGIGNYERAIGYLLEAINFYEKNGSFDSDDYAICLGSLGAYYMLLGKPYKSEVYILKSIAIKEKNLGLNYKSFSEDLIGLSQTYFNLNKFEKAEYTYLKSYKIERKRILDFYSATSERQQNAYSDLKRGVISLGYSYFNISQNMQAWAYDNSLFMKGLQLQTANNLITYLYSSANTIILSKFKDYQEVKSSLSRLYSNNANNSSQIEYLETRAEELEKYLSSSSSEFRDFLNSFQTNYVEIKKKLSKNQVSIEFIDFQWNDGKLFTNIFYYTAIIVRPEWTFPKMVILCQSTDLEKVINSGALNKNTSYINSIYSIYQLDEKCSSIKTPTSLKRSNKLGVEPAQNGSELQKNLYELIWQPIDSLLIGAKTIFYSPSGLLHRINLSAIPLNSQKRFGDIYELHLLSSTKQLAFSTEIKQTENKRHILIMGNINYDADSTSIFKANQSYKNKNIDSYLTRNIEYTNNSVWSSLANTGSEVNSIASISKNIFQTDLLQENQATEEAFYQYIQKEPKIIHLATHGFFYESPIDTLSIKRNEPIFINSTNALIRSGLVLAGANHVWQGKPKPQNQEDGILTAYEISLLNLRNTELVVLSACETGLGDIKGSEGVFGLQRAFKIAGAKNLIMSLWQIPDYATSKLMEAFYGYYLSDKKSIPIAFNEAIKQMQKIYKEPYYWAGFVLVE